MVNALNPASTPPQHAFPAHPHPLPLPLPHPHPQSDCSEYARPKCNRLLLALPEAAFQGWLPELEAVEMPLGMVIREPGRPQKHVYFPTTSIAALMYGLEDGRTGAVSVVGNEGMVGISTFMGGDSTLGSSVVLCAGRGYRMRASTLMAAFEKGGAITRLLLRYTQAVMAQLAQVVVCNRHHSIEQRCCRFLLSMMDRLHGRTTFPMTHELMASVLGVRREGVTECAQALQRSGLLRYQRGLITVLDRAGLARRSCECHGVVTQEYERLLPSTPLQ